MKISRAIAAVVAAGLLALMGAAPAGAATVVQSESAAACVTTIMPKSGSAIAYRTFKKPNGKYTVSSIPGMTITGMGVCLGSGGYLGKSDNGLWHGFFYGGYTLSVKVSQVRVS